VTLPPAQVKHRSPTRMRIRIPSQRGNTGYFEQVRKAFSDSPGLTALEVNADTGSVLFLGEEIDPERLQQVARENKLYELSEHGTPGRTIPNRSVEPVAAMNRGVRKATGGSLDLSGLLFFSLLGTAVYQILRGNMAAPPWYTAFWYAFGVYTKQLIDDSNEAGDNG